MSYRCDICGIKVPPKRQRLVHQVVRQRQIVRELACCEGCHVILKELPLSSVKDPYYLRPRKFRDVDTITVVREVKPSALQPEAIQFDLEETFSRR